MNSSDTERLAAVLESLGYQPSPDEEKADLLFFNTCSIRKKAEDKFYGLMRHLVAKKKVNPNLLIGVTGCMVRISSTKKSPKKDKLARVEAIDLALRIEDLSQLSTLLKEIRPNLKLNSKSDKEIFKEGSLGSYFEIQPKRATPFQAWIPIQTGCDKFCTYCIVPFSRGREHSRVMEEIVVEAKKAVKQGAIEITLLGQTVDSYGLSVADKLSGKFAIQDDIPNVVFNLTASSKEAKIHEKAQLPFVILLKELDKLHTKGLRRLRFMSPHPQDFSEDLILLHQELKTLQPYIHLPLQSGNNEVLKAMRRPYTREYYLHLIELLKKYLPNCAITTDLIVGFPGETEKAFQDTVEMMKNVKFDMAFIAPYSPRPGTYAAKHLKDDVPVKEKARRFHELTAVLKIISRRKNEAFLDKEVEVLVEKHEKGRCSGRTPQSKQVFFDSSANMVGRLITVKITQAHDWFLEGCPL